MGRRKLQLDSLIPERDVFQDTDGAEYDFRARVDFGPVDQARLRRMEKDFNRIMEALGDKPDDEQLAGELDRLMSDFLRTIVPDLPAERLSAIQFGIKAEVIRWWTEQQKASAEGEAKAGETKKSAP